MTEKTDTRSRILEAAMARIKHYGYSKTTMSEIAKDCNMSAGNIYRFFKSKIDIAEAMAEDHYQETHKRFIEIAGRSGSAAQKLYDLFDYSLRATFEKLDSDAKILEVAEVLSSERPEHANRLLSKERTIMVDILKDGIAKNEFAAMKDIEFTAEMIQSALMKFVYPQLWTRLSLPELLREFEGVMALVLAGLKQGVNSPELVSAE